MKKLLKNAIILTSLLMLSACTGTAERTDWFSKDYSEPSLFFAEYPNGDLVIDIYAIGHQQITITTKKSFDSITRVMTVREPFNIAYGDDVIFSAPIIEGKTGKWERVFK